MDTHSTKIPPQLLQQLAWSRGPPHTYTSASSAAASTSPRSQSSIPSQNATQSPIPQSHSRRHSVLCQGVSIQEEVSIPRSHVGAAKTKRNSPVKFCSIDDADAPISSISPISVPQIKSEGAKPFGSVPATNSSTVDGKASPYFTSSQAGSSSLRRSISASSYPPVVPKASTSLVPKPALNPPSSSSAPGPSPTPTLKLNKVDIYKLFVSPSTVVLVSSSTNSDISSPAIWPTTLPSTSSHPLSSSQSGQPSQPSQVLSFTHFVPSAGFRQPTSTNASASTSRSPAYQRQMTNGTSGGVGVSNRQSSGPGASGGPQNVQSGVHSPRLGLPNSPELVERKVKSLLNKLTMEKFESISDQIITWANKSEKEKDGRTLIKVVKLVFEKATDEAAWSEMYARLCRKMTERISPDVQDDGIKNSEGKPITGGQLFRMYLLNCCQEGFERGWAAKDATATAAAAKASEDEAAKKAAETSGEAELYSDEYYAAQKAKRQGLGLIQFIGELYKLQMLTERIMHECIKKLLGNVDNPEEEEIESLCRLLTTVGQLLDNVKARAHMDIYFSRMKELIKRNNVSSQMLQDLLELRERKWIPRNQVAAPSTLAQVHEAAAKERMAHEKEASTRTLAMSRGGSRRGGDRAAGGEQTQGAYGRSVAGGLPRPPPKAGDLSNFGKINKAATMIFGPSSVFAGKKDTKRDSTLSRTSSSSNMFSMLSGGEDPAAAASAAKSSRPSSRRTSVDFGQSGVPEPPAQRRKLQLLPRTSLVEETRVNGASEEQSEDESDNAQREAEKKFVEDIKEFFQKHRRVRGVLLET